MRIIKFTAENVKRISLVEITPQGDIVEIAGDNGNGKTSVLDAIYWTLDSARNIQGEPVRRGAKRGRVELAIGEGKDVRLVVERTFTKSGSYLKVTTPDGASYAKPQQILDDMIGALSFDPLQFMRSPAAKQFDILKEMLGLEVELSVLEREHRELYDKRRDINRAITQQKTKVDSLQGVQPATPVDVTDIFARMKEAEAHNNEVRHWQAQIEAAEKAAARAANAAAEAARALADARKAEQEAAATLAELRDRPIAEPIGVAHFEQELRLAQETNAQAKAYEARQEAERLLAESQNESEDITALMEALDRRKLAMISKAKPPIEGLSLGQGVVTFNDLPLEQASDAEQLKVSTAVAAALNPKLRVIRIRDGSLLDKSSMKWLAAFAAEQKMQIWIECVGDGGPGAVIMEDGHVRGAPPPEADDNAKTGDFDD